METNDGDFGLDFGATRVLVVDDSPLVRQIFVDAIRREPDLEVVGYARDGEEALLRVAELNPDVVVLDLEMPRLDGLGCLREMMAARPTRAVMLSHRLETAHEALELGAVDFVIKPDDGSLATLRGIREELVQKVRQAAARADGTLPRAA